MNDSKASEVLEALNGLVPVDVAGLEFCVITNREDGTSYWPFSRGEILVVDKMTGREPFGEGRKPAKWAVEAEYASTLTEARVIRERVLAADEAEVLP